MKEVKGYCIARSSPALRALLRFLSFPMHSPLNVELSDVQAFSSIASESSECAPGLSSAFERYPDCFANAFDKDLSESPHFPGRDMIQVEERTYRVLPVASGIYNFSRQ